MTVASGPSAAPNRASRRPPALAERKPAADPFGKLRRRPGDDERDRPAAAGPLAHQGPAAAATPVRAEPIAVAAVADRILTRVDGRGDAAARIDLSQTLRDGAWAGAHVELVAGARGVEVNVFAATAAARAVIQAKLDELRDALARRGVRVRKLSVAAQPRR
jgi:hypothetical protein